ncbi:YdiU family protein [Xinfangfangia sp. CPCC 101601]|uniref:Protein nucleotidyltransferase YdiU n=1 Tax=Pseudogemmobacter lacusdianii TaxID=3069608 RepID=A0ABU0W1A5_9RHOB|nr:YdiU family protein [Xinfangfangia sp. CPCC 101601]MDQ2067543.1 YdiU family protein [Xinfangfangia sp. CPCC 101601]
MDFHFSHSWARDLPGMYLRQAPDVAPAPRLLALNQELAEELGLDAQALQLGAAEWFSGAKLPPGADPLALAYAGHQFGGFSPVLGDGRAHLLGEIVTPQGARFDVQLKGSGRTGFSRGGDGKAAIGPMLREYLISEAMQALGVPTTRALAVVATGEDILRQEGPVPGAVLARIAASHIRVGSFQFLAARGEVDKLRDLMDYTLERHFPGVSGALGLFDAVAARQAKLIAQWMGLGFIHGVMNTDNMALSGETIDYGPCAFMEGYAPGTVFSSIDRQGRYAYANQPLILGWNLARLLEALLPLIDPDSDKAVEIANARLDGISALYEAAWAAEMRRKLALEGEEPGDAALVADLLSAMTGADWTLTFHRLAGAVEGEGLLRPLFENFTAMQAWLPRWRARLGRDAVQRLRAANPAVIPRNHQVEAALHAATGGDLRPFHALLAAVTQPFVEDERYMLPAPSSFGRYVTFCGT